MRYRIALLRVKPCASNMNRIFCSVIDARARENCKENEWKKNIAIYSWRVFVLSLTVFRSGRLLLHLRKFGRTHSAQFHEVKNCIFRMRCNSERRRLDQKKSAWISISKRASKCSRSNEYGKFEGKQKQKNKRMIEKTVQHWMYLYSIFVI